MISQEDIIYMQRALELAALGTLSVRPNPLVGAVIVKNNRIIGEGFHYRAGEPHAEVNAVNVAPAELLKGSTIYVNLEPCSHFGRTPPCAELLVKSGFGRVVIGTVDTSSKVSGKGIEILRKGACLVETGVLEKECREINRRFFKFHESGRPYIILKWARTKDGFIDRERKEADTGRPNWITGEWEQTMVHRWRAEEHSILVGANTLINDNPELTARKIDGPDPLRLVLTDRDVLAPGLRMIEDGGKTLVFSIKPVSMKNNNSVENVVLKNRQTAPEEILDELVSRDIQSLIVEGGADILQQFIDKSLWDEARIFTGNIEFGSGIIAPEPEGTIFREKRFESSTLVYLKPKE